MSVTIRDIAQATGLSIGTVSRALKNQGGMSDETRSKISLAAQGMGYDVGQLRPGRIKRIAFMLHQQHNTVPGNPFFALVLQGAQRACEAEGIALSCIALGPAESFKSQLRAVQPDAILCAGFFEPETLDALRANGKPVALVDMQMPGYNSINADNRYGAYLAARHLIQSGRKRIALLSGSLSHFSIQERVHGFRKALFNAKMLADPELEICIPSHAKQEDGVRQAMRHLLGMTRRPDALFCYNDSTALAAMQYCLDAGLRVPQDIAIVGFDDIDAAAQSTPPLSTVRVDKEALGAAGIALLLRPAGEKPLERSLSVDLIVRESSRSD